MSRTEAQILKQVEAQYAATREHLVTDETYRALEVDAEREARETPTSWIARNRAHLYVETRTPLYA